MYKEMSMSVALDFAITLYIVLLVCIFAACIMGLIALVRSFFK